MARVFDGRAFASSIEEGLKERIKKLDAFGVKPALAVVSVGENEGASIYSGQLGRAAGRLSVRFESYPIPSDGPEERLLYFLQKLGKWSEIHAIMLQTPLPPAWSLTRAGEAILPAKDVECLNPVNGGKLLGGDISSAPATARAVLEILERESIPVGGADVCVVNHSPVVGRPLANLLLARNATVSVCHIYTKDLKRHAAAADILITGAGKAGLITEEMVKEGAAVIDVGMNRVEGRVCGDVRFDEAKGRASFITPVPGGVGPVTVAVTLERTVAAAESFAARGGFR